MREDIGLKGDDLNYITATFWASYCTFMIPACYFMTHYPANIVLPTLEVGWGLSTFGLAWARNVETLYAMRFFTGVFECCSFTGTIYIIGSWYKPGEIGRRVALFFIASPLGTMFAGYLQAAAYTNLNGTHGLAGWRWVDDHARLIYQTHDADNLKVVVHCRRDHHDTDRAHVSCTSTRFCDGPRETS